MITDSFTAAQAAAGVNLASGKNYSQSNRYRKFNGFGMVGSTNPNDCAIDVFIGGVYIGTFRNSRGGANLSVNKDDILAFNIIAEPNEVLELVVKTAAATNAIVIGIDVDYLT